MVQIHVPQIDLRRIRFAVYLLVAVSSILAFSPVPAAGTRVCAGCLVLIVRVIICLSNARRLHRHLDVIAKHELVVGVFERGQKIANVSVRLF